MGQLKRTDSRIYAWVTQEVTSLGTSYKENAYNRPFKIHM